MSNKIKEVTDDSFAIDALQSSIPVLVEFWADWCGPCKTIESILEVIAEEFAGRIKIVKVNVDHNQETTNSYKITGIPAIVIIKSATIVTTKTGVLTKSQLEDIINGII